jgi:transcriptional regulator with GAF, ATPase, and Fis domain
VNERLEAEQKIRTLTVEAEYLRDEIRALRCFDEVVGDSRPMRQILGQVKEVAATDATVLLLGETGTGKEVIARAIHAASPRQKRPMIKVNCAAMPAALIESELFGHEKGAFTGATQRREGRVALAHEGSLFLDEIGELPLELQVKLLRVLQEGEFEPVGSSKTKKVDVRVLAATNRDLHQAVQDKEFREDLYYRLNVFPIALPPLRDRGEDVALLASTFAEQFARRMGRTFEGLSPDCVRRLTAYSWPGNVRELQNVIERAVILSCEGRLDLDRALPEATPSGAAIPSTGNGESPILKVKELRELERDNIVRALEAVDWRVSGDRGAARLLDTNASTLSSRMKALGITPPRQRRS